MAYNKKAHLRDNIEAIRLMFRLEKEQRAATPEEAGILAAYSGFGGIKAVLSPFGKLTDILRWTQADRELFPLITELHNVLRDGAADEREYRRLVESVKASTFTAFYTPPAIVNAIASSLGEHGVSPGRFLDPSSGTGNFVSAFRPQCHSASGNTPEIVAYEKDLLTGRILARPHPCPAPSRSAGQYQGLRGAATAPQRLFRCGEQQHPLRRHTCFRSLLRQRHGQAFCAEQPAQLFLRQRAGRRP